MKRLGQLLSVLTWVLVVASIIIITGGLFDRPLLLAAVPTGSMVPVLNPGDLIVVLPTWLTPEPKLGDIVVYKTAEDHNWIVHRIIDGNPTEGFVIKGDANHVPDPRRVYPRDIAGVVPQPSGAALRLPRLGLLSLSQGPLSNPVVAGIALAMGLYLLVLDARPGGFRKRVRRQARARPGAIALMYVGLAGAAFLSTLIPAWTLSTRQMVRYEVVEQHPANVQITNQYIVGTVHEEQVDIANPSSLPILVGFETTDPAVTYSPGWAVIPPHGKTAFQARVQATELGKHESTSYMGVFLPLLPAKQVEVLAHINLVLAACVTALIPALAVLLLALADMRSRAVFYRWRLKLLWRFQL